MAHATWSRWVVLSLFMLAAVSVQAGQFRVDPITLTFDSRKKISSFKILNTGEEPLKVQMSAVIWRQDEKGKDFFEPGKALLIFPKLATIKPQGVQVVRVAYRGKTILKEEITYRLFVAELPVFKETRIGVRITLRVGMPVFVLPTQDKEDWGYEGAVLEQGKLILHIRNNGTRHLVVRKVFATGTDEGGQQVFSGSTAGWYVLPGATRPFDIAIGRDSCLKLRNLTMRANTSSSLKNTEVKIQVNPAPSQCPLPPGKSGISPSPPTPEKEGKGN